MTLKTQISTLLLALLLPFIQLGGYASALSSEQLNLYRSGINWYDVNSVFCDPMATSGASPGKVYMIGDSITVGSTPALTGKFASPWSISINAQDSRSAKELVDIISADYNQVSTANAVVIALGANDLGSSFDSYINETMDAIRDISPDVSVFWVDSASTKNDYSQINKDIYDNSANRNYQVISWFKTVFPGQDPVASDATLVDKNGYIDDDGYFVHPVAGEGTEAFSQTIFDSVSASTGRTAVSAGGSSGSYTLPSNIPEPLKTIMEEAAREHGADVLIMAALYSSENALWQNDDYLKDDWRIDKVHANSWSTSGSAAKGPFQFIPNTWNAYEQEGPFIYEGGLWTTRKGSGDGINIDHIDDAAYAAAEFVVALGGTAGIPLGSADDDVPKHDQPKTVANVFKSYSKGGSIWRENGVWLKSDGTPLPSTNQTGLTSYITQSLKVYQGLGGAGTAQAECITSSANIGPVDYSANPNVKVEEATSCIPGPLQPGLFTVREYILNNWSPPVSSVGDKAVCRSVVGGDARSLHSEGRAIDIFLNANDSEDLAMGDHIRDWLIFNAEALGCQRVIWNKYVWSANTDGWREYYTEGSGRNPHTNHIHAELNWDGALMHTSFFSQ